MPSVSTRRVVPAVVTLAVGFASLGWIATAGTLRGPGAPYIPDDGEVARVKMLDGDLAQLESALRPVGLLNGTLGQLVAHDPSLSPDEVALRLTFSPDAAQDEVVLVAHDGALQLHGISIDGVGRVFGGGIALEPGEVGGSVEIAGGGGGDYTGTVVVVEGGDGCDDVAVDLDLAGDAERLSLTLCADLGTTALRYEPATGEPVGFSATTEDVPFAFTSLEVPDRDWSAASGWQPAAYVPTATDAFGESTGAGAPAGTPAALLSGDIAVLDGLADDVVVYRPAPDGVAEMVWRGHPGGQVVGVVAVGDMVVAVRTGGSMVAYSVDGVRIWESASASDSVVGAVVPVTGALTFATLDGLVWLVDAATGAVTWSREVAERLTDGVIADDRVTFAFDDDGRMVGFTPTGDQAFDGDIPGTFDAVALDETNSYLAQSGSVVEAYELQYSQFQWAASMPEAVTALCSTEDVLAVATTEQTYAVDPSTGSFGLLDERADALECGRSAVAIAIGDTVWVRPTDGSAVSLQVSATVVDLDFRGLAPAADGLWVLDERAFVWWSG